MTQAKDLAALDAADDGFSSATYVAFAEALKDAYRTGQLVPVPSVEDVRGALVELLFEHDPNCGHADCEYTAKAIAEPLLKLMERG